MMFIIFCLLLLWILVSLPSFCRRQNEPRRTMRPVSLPQPPPSAHSSPVWPRPDSDIDPDVNVKIGENDFVRDTVLVVATAPFAKEPLCAIRRVSGKELKCEGKRAMERHVIDVCKQVTWARRELRAGRGR